MIQRLEVDVALNPVEASIFEALCEGDEIHINDALNALLNVVGGVCGLTLSPEAAAAHFGDELLKRVAARDLSETRVLS